MLRHIPVLFTLALLAGCQGAGTVNPDQQKSSPSTDQMSGSGATLVVHGMGCPMCANNIDKQLLRVPGVQKVRIDLGSGEVAVQFVPDAHPSRQRIVDAVEDSGFTLREVRQP